MTDLAVDLQHVSKTYRGRIHALQGVEMRVQRGEIFGLLGPNGAGKSTLVKIMMTVVRPTHVEGTVLGRPVGDKATLARIGYLPENHRFPRYLTGRQTLEFFAAMAHVDSRTAKRRAVELLDTVGMTDAADRRVSTYSKGMLQRIGLAQALMNDPELILLDEPTDGVDPMGRREMRALMLRLREAGKTLFINSHVLSELEMICDRVAILLHGRVAMQGRLEELTVARQRYEIEVAGDDPLSASRSLMSAIAANWHDAPASNGVIRGTMSDGAWVEVAGPTLSIGVTEPAQIQPMIDALRGARMTIRRAQLVRPSLEDLFMAAVADNGGMRERSPERELAASGNGER